MKRLLLLLSALACLGAAADPSERLSDPAREARARALMQEIRCLVCQNESIDDSEADLARQLRRVVREQVAAGRTDTEVKGYLVRRYGDFVLLRPRLTTETVVLWAAPVLVILAGALLSLFMLRGRRSGLDEPLSPEERARLRELAGVATIPTDGEQENAREGEARGA